MAYIRLSDGTYPLSETQVRYEHPHTAFPAPFNPEGYAWVFPKPMPVYNKIMQGCRESAPELTPKGHYEQSWEVFALTAEQSQANQAAKDAEDAALIKSKIDALWNAADNYVSGYISGVAIGLLTLGMVQSKPKALAVTAWSSSVWDAYYTRKASVTATSADDLDFTSFGPMPYTVPELRAELGL